MKLLKDMTIAEVRRLARQKESSTGDTYERILKELLKQQQAAKKRARLWG